MAIALKIFAAIAAVACWIWTQKLIHQRHRQHFGDSEQKIVDSVHRWTAGLNLKLQNNKTLANALLISSSAVIDLLGIYLMLSGIFGSSLRPLLGIILLFTLRQLVQVLTSLPTPQGMIWHNPGFPSLLVTYGISNDLFFSGHTALACFGAMELMQLGHPAFTFLAWLIMLYEVSVVLILRAHWTLDVFTGAIAAFWIFKVSQELSPLLDGFLISM